MRCTRRTQHESGLCNEHRPNLIDQFIEFNQSIQNIQNIALIPIVEQIIPHALGKIALLY
jgi:hypothetical protein